MTDPDDNYVPSASHLSPGRLSRQEAHYDTRLSRQEAQDNERQETEENKRLRRQEAKDAGRLSWQEVQDDVRLIRQEAYDDGRHESEDDMRLRRQEAQDDTRTVTVDVSPTSGNKVRPPFAALRSDTARGRYGGLDEIANVQKYTEPLLIGVNNNDSETVRQLLEQDVNVDAKENNFTALHIAARNDNCDILELLLNKGADCNVKDKEQRTPLHIAVKKNHILCSEKLLTCDRMDINVCDKNHDTPLHYAAKEGRLEICTMMLRHIDERLRNKKNVIVNAQNRKRMTPLHYSAQENHYNILSLLLNNNSDWKRTDNSGYSALHYAAQKGFQECCQVLLSNVSTEGKNEQLNIRLKDGKTPLMLAAKEGNHYCCRILEYRDINATDNEGYTALHYAAERGFDCTVEDLLKAGADPNTQRKNDISPVLDAAAKGKFGCLRILAENGANLNVFDSKEKSILHHVTEKNAYDALEFLLTSPSTSPIVGSILNEKDINGCTPLHLAIKRNATDCAILLLKNGASPVVQCAGGMTPLHLAADKGDTSVCDALLSKTEVTVSQENDDKATPLHMAALCGSVDICQMLIRKGARLTAVDGKGRNALHVASAYGYADVVKFLLKKGIPQIIKDDTGSSALHLAASKGSLECCRVLVTNSKLVCWEVDGNGNLPLSRAYKNKDNNTLHHDQVFKFLLQHMSSKDSKKKIPFIHEYMHKALQEENHTIIDAIVDSCWWEAGIFAEKGHQCSVFHTLIKNYPSVALRVQEKCITRTKGTKSEVTYDFRFFEDSYTIPSGRCKHDHETDTTATFTEDGLKWKHNHPLTLMISHKCHELLQHPLTKMWLIQKWGTYFWKIFCILLFIELVFSFCLVLFMEFADNWSHVQEKCNLTEQQFCNISYHPTTKLGFDNTGLETTDWDDDVISSQFNECNETVIWKRVIWSFLILLTLVTCSLELNYALRLKKEYFYQNEHRLQMAKIFFSILAVIPWSYCEFYYVVLNDMNWQCGIIAFLLTGLHLINTINQLPMLSIFMPVTFSFLKSFFKVVFYIAMIIFIFAFSFHLLLKDHDAFLTIPQAVVKTIVWMLGDLGYDDTFLSDEHVLNYPVMVNLLFVIFVTFLGGFIANMITTQPTNELDNFRTKASFHRDSNRTQLFLKLDLCFPFFQKLRTIGSYVDVESGNDQGDLPRKLLMLDEEEEEEETKQTEQIDSIQMQLQELNKQILELNQQLLSFSEQREDVRELKNQLKSFTKLLVDEKRK